MTLPLLFAQVPVGQYISVWKVIPLVLVVLGGARFLTWVDKDAPRVLLPRIPINMGLFAGWVMGIILFLLLPSFLVAMPVLVLVTLAFIGTYLGMRHQKVGLGDLKGQFRDWVRGWGSKKKAEVQVIPGEVVLIDRKGASLPEPLPESPERPTYDAVQAILTDPLRRDAERIDVFPVEGEFAARYVVDGITYTSIRLDKTRGAAAVAFMKKLAGLDLNEKRKPQMGTMRTMLDGRRRELQVETAGSAVGEQLRVSIDIKSWHDKALDELGMGQEQVEAIRRSIVEDNTGIVVVASPKGHGLTTMLYAILRAHDAFLTHIVTIEPTPDVDIEGITQNRLSTTPNPVEDSRIVEWVVSQEPDVLMCSRVEDTRVATTLARFGGTGRRVYVGLRAGGVFEALALWRKLVGDDRLATKDLKLVVAGRVVRKLCGACKIGYVPDPATLRKLNMDPDKVGKLYQARAQPMQDAKGNVIPCDFCKELHYKSRLGIHEMLVVDDEVRNVVETGGTVNQLKGIFRKQRGRYLQEQGLSLVERGETSVQEVLRVMKVGEPAAAPPPAAPQPTAATPQTPR
jgi:general secretion pathway protein E